MPGRRFNPRLPPLSKELRTGWLLLLLRAEPSYGYVLRRELRARGLDVEPSALYRGLRELESDGLIASSWMHRGPGPRARVYTVTPKGLSSLEMLAAGIDRSRRAQGAFLSAYGDLHDDDDPDP